MEGILRRRTPLTTQVLLVIGAALFSSAKWTALADIAEAMPATYLARFAGIATFIVVAVLFRQRPISSNHLFGVAVPLMVVYVLVTTIGALPQGQSLGAALYAAGLLYGVASSLLTLFFLTALASFGPARCAVLLVLLELASNCFAVAFDSVNPAFLLVVRNAALFVSVGVFFLVSRWNLEPLANCPDACESSSAAKLSAFPSSLLEWVVLLAAAAVFHGLFGVIAQVSSPAEHSFALYDSGSTAIVIALEILLLVFLCFRGASFGFVEVLVFVTVLYATGFALYSYAWAASSVAAGALIRSGFSFSSVLLRALVARKAYFDPRRSSLYFGAYCAVASVYPGRILGSFLSQIGGPQTALCESVSLAALWMICIFGIIVLFLACGRKSCNSATPSLFEPFAFESQTEEKTSEETGTIPDGDDGAKMAEADAFAQRAMTFSRRLQLSRREEEVLVEVLHGCSRVRIAEKLCLSPGTVKSYVSRIYSKAGVSSKQELISLVEKEPIS